MQKLLALLGAKNKEEFVELFKQFIKFSERLFTEVTEFQQIILIELNQLT